MVVFVLVWYVDGEFYVFVVVWYGDYVGGVLFGGEYVF